MEVRHDRGARRDGAVRDRCLAQPRVPEGADHEPRPTAPGCAETGRTGAQAENPVGRVCSRECDVRGDFARTASAVAINDPRHTSHPLPYGMSELPVIRATTILAV